MWDFTIVNPLQFHGYIVEEEPQEFIDEMYKVSIIMGVTPMEKEELSSYEIRVFS